MASTCKDCGTPTWGRYRICPSCRKTRKKQKNSQNGPPKGHWFLCKKCNHTWKIRKSRKRPNACPDCNSKRIIFDCQKNLILGWIIGIGGILFSIFTFNNPSIKFFRTISTVIALPILIGTIILYLKESDKNKKILSKYD